MAFFEITFKRSAEKDLRRLPPELVPRVFRKIESLAENPFPSQSIKLTDTEKIYRLRVGDYRIIYEADTEVGIVTVHYIRHCREVYRKMR